MIFNSLFKKQAAVVHVLIFAIGCMWALELPAQVITARSELEVLKEDCNKSGNANSDECKAYRNYRDSLGGNNCANAINEYNTNRKDLSSACGKVGAGKSLNACLNRIDKCSVTEERIGEAEYDAGGFDPEDCEERLSNEPCLDLTAGSLESFEEDRKAYEQQKKDSQKYLVELTEEQGKMMRRAQEQQEEQAQNAFENERKIRDREREIMDNLEAEMKNIDENVKARINQVQEAYLKLDEQYIVMRDQLRQAQSAITTAEESLNTTCRAAAQKKYDQEEAALQQRIERENQTIRSHRDFTKQAGYYRRNKRRLAQNRTQNYLGHYQACMKGSTPEGSSARSQISQSKRQAENLSKRLEEQSVLLEKSRQLMLAQLEQLSNAAPSDKLKLIQQAQEKLRNLNQDYQRMQALNQQRITNNQMQMAQQQMMIGQQMMNAQKDLQEANARMMAAHSRNKCVKLKPQSSIDRAQDGLPEAVGSIESVLASCNNVKFNCAADNQQAQGITTFCTDFEKSTTETKGSVK